MVGVLNNKSILDDARDKIDAAGNLASQDDVRTFDNYLSERANTSMTSFVVPTTANARTENMIIENVAFGAEPLTFQNSEVGNQLRFDSTKSSKLDGDLQLLANANIPIASALNPTAYDAALRTQFPDLVIRDGKVVIDIGAEDPAATLIALEALGLENGGTSGYMVSGLLPVSAISALEGLDGLRFAQASQVISNVGATTNQSDAALRADDARSEYLLDGSGLNIGILSDSFDNLDGYLTDIGTADLPVGVNILDDSTVGESDEGRAMAQIIHDIAPSGGLLFHTAFTGQANFAQGIIDLAAAGADIIVDDVFYLSEPFFQDGVIAQAVDTVTAGGALYFSSAGNSADKSYESAFVDSGIIANGTVLHDFNIGAGVDTGFGFTLAAGETIRIGFQWDQPFFSVSGAAGSLSDLDFFIFEQGTQIAVTSSLDSNVGGDPTEVLTYTNNTGSDQLLDFSIGLFQGPPAGLMKFAIFRGDPLALEYSLGTSTSVGHSNAEGTLAVGAAAYFNTPDFGTFPAVANSFTSLGGTSILFDVAGNRLTTPIMRDNVDFTAPDGGNTTFFGNDVEPDGFPNFFGTSASAPAAAAVAALLFQAAPNATLAQIEAVFEATAIDMGPAGYDQLTGAGLIQADAALFALLDITDNVLVGNSIANSFDGRGGNDFIDGNDGADTLLGGAGNDILRGGDGGDSIDGGADSDTVSYTGSNLPVFVRLFNQTAFGGHANGDTLISIEHVIGSSKDDDIIGSNIANVLDGSAGVDKINGFTGDDIIIGGRGGDMLDGGIGNDTVSYTGSSLGVFVRLFNNSVFGGDANGDTIVNFENVTGSSNNDDLIGSVGANVLIGGLGADRLDGFRGDDMLSGGDGMDVLIGGEGDDILTGGDGGDQLYLAFENPFLNGANDGDNTAFGGKGNDNIFSGRGADNIDGGDDFDQVAYLGSAAGVTVNLGTGLASGGDAEGDSLVNIEAITASFHDDNLTGNSGGNIIFGNAGNDIINGGGGADNLLGLEDNDTINGGTGSDNLDGGDGIDTVSYEGSAAGVFVRLFNNSVFGGDANGDTIANFENVIGSSNNDDLIGSNGANTLDGGAGNDTINGFVGDDLIIGGAGGDNLDGGDGIDTLSYAGSASSLGVFVRLFNNSVFGGDANGDTIANFENATGSSNNDDLIGSLGANTLDGGAGNDKLNGYIGDDILIGGAGNDLVIGGAGGDNLDGGADIDTVSYAGSTLGVFVRLFNNSVFGGDANGDTIVNFENATGSSNNDDLIGSNQANTLDGGAGADKLNGFVGDDILIGGAGDDLFVFTGTSGSDTITDFTAGAGSEDKIDLQDSVFTDLNDVLVNTVDDGLGNTVISKSGVSISLNGVTKAQLHEDDFVFAIGMAAPLQGQLQGSAVLHPDIYSMDPIDTEIELDDTNISNYIGSSQEEALEPAAIGPEALSPISKNMMIVQYQGGPTFVDDEMLDLPFEFLAG
jgi:Ca2+-binding RTX toxin-like protein